MEKNYIGLTSEEVIKNQKLYGKNFIDYNKKNKTIKNIVKNLIILLVIISLFTCISFDNKLNIIIFITIITLITITYILLQIKSVKKFNIVKKSLNKKTTVIRNGKEETINDSDITIDDILIISSGKKIDADAIILESNNLYVDESSLTNNNKPVKKSIDLLDKNAYLKSNYLYKNTLVTKGNAIVKVINIGNKTEYAKKIKSLQNKEEQFKLKKQIYKLIKIFTIISIILFIVSSILITIKTNNIKYGLLSGITLFISITPEYLILILLTFLSTGIYKLFKKSAIIKNIELVEKLRKTTCLFIEQKGLITEEKFKIKEIYSNEIEDEKLLKNALLSCNKNDELFYTINEINNEKIDNHKLIKNYPSTKEINMEAKVYQINEENYIFVHGTLENLFDICKLDVEQKYELHTFQKQLYKKGVNVIAVASKKIDKIEDDIFNYNIHFDGLIGLYNPLKDDINKQIEKIQESNIKIIMISDDNTEIASTIAKQVGIKNYANYITGGEIDELSDEQLAIKLKSLGVFSQIIPHHKLRIINILKNNGEIVSTTASNITDLLSLKNSQIKIALENNKIEIIKEVADLILLDNNLKTIVNTIKDSKIIYKRIKISTIITIIINIFCLLLSILLLNYKLYLLPLFIILLKFITYIICFIIFNKKLMSNN